MSPRQSPLQQELRQTRPFQSPGHEGVIGLLRTADLIRRLVGRVVETRGVTLQQYNVLRILKGAAEDGLPTLEVAARMVEETPGITRLLDRLEAKRLVRRERCPRDRRQHLCRLTEEGARLLQALDKPVLQANEACLKALPGSEQRRLIRLLDRVRSAHQ